MKDYFARLIDYDQYTNLAITELIINAGSPEKPEQLMAHVLGAQRVWFSRCKGDPSPGGAIWPDWKADTFVQRINEGHDGWNFLNSTEPGDFEKTISYQDSRGNSHVNKLMDIIAHMINHGTHHRAQIGQHLKLAGIDLPMTDYIFYIRQLEQNK